MAKNTVRLRHQQTHEGTSGDKPAVPDIHVSERQAQVYRKNGWRDLTQEELAAEQAEAPGDDSEDSAAPNADDKPAAPRSRGKGAAAAADEKES